MKTKILNNLQLVMSINLIAVAITLAVNYFAQNSWASTVTAIKGVCYGTLVSTLIIICLREIKFLRGKYENDGDAIAIILGVILSGIATLLFYIGQFTDSPQISVQFAEKMPWVVMGVSFIWGLMHSRYSIIINVTATTLFCVILSPNFSDYLTAIGWLSLATVSSFIVRLVLFIKWSTLTKDEKKEGLEIVK